MNKVYVVDDSPSVCFAVESILGPKGYEVVVERSGSGALANLESEAPDLVLCDLVLPDVEGFDICDFIRKSPVLSDIPIIVISGIVDDEIKTRALDFDIKDVLKKPFGTDELLAAVKNGLQERAATLAAPSAVPEAPSEPEPEADRVEADEPSAEPVETGEETPILAELNARIEVRFSLLMDSEGEVMHSSGVDRPKENAALAKGVAAMLRNASDVTSQVGFDAVRDLTLEWNGGSLVMHPMADGQILVLSPGEPVGLGKARYLVRRMVRERNAQAL